MIQQITEQRNSEKFRHELIFSSLTIRNFTTGQGEELQKNVAGYDSARQIETVKQLVAAVQSLYEWEQRQ